ncbi:hypothetical protein V491_09418 [Pseudogymnoascus sp. VKM F-3775]|nr:hypothetical protein V491_09418 [Pseudogymnoascus sp. VKM F-3775]
MVRSLPYAALLCIGLVAAQTPGKIPEKHPKLDTWECTKKHGCKKQESYIVIDQASHPNYQLNEPSLNCGDWGSAPNVTVCPDEKTCAKNCIVEGIPDYSKVGVTTKGGNLFLKQLSQDGSVVSPRVYLLEKNQQEYEMLKLTGREFSFDVDTSKLPCGMNGALYLSEMDKKGGKSKLNPGGAYYGSGYCDAQCFTFPFVEGVGNIEGKGACCNEMDIWEANSEATSIAPHICKHDGLYRCTGEECDFEGECDEWGCGYNPYALGNKNYYGLGLKVDTRRPYTVVTQFPAVKGKMTEIRRLYVQDGKVIQNAAVNITGPPVQNFMDDNYCTNKPGSERYMELGGMEAMGGALSRGMVLIFSIWWDEGGFMQWLDGESSGSGPCDATEGDPKNIVKIQPDPAVTFSNVKWGEIDSTYSARKGPRGPGGPRGISY